MEKFDWGSFGVGLFFAYIFFVVSHALTLQEDSVRFGYEYAQKHNIDNEYICEVRFADRSYALDGCHEYIKENE